jgi:hypothetical protein
VTALDPWFLSGNQVIPVRGRVCDFDLTLQTRITKLNDKNTNDHDDEASIDISVFVGLPTGVVGILLIIDLL